MQELVSGVIIGVGAGLTTSIILGLWRTIIRYLERSEQITYMRELMSDQLKQILTASDLPPPTPESEPVPADFVRYALFRQFQTDLQVALSFRSTSLTYKEIAPLQKILANIDRTLNDLTLHQRKLMPLSIAQSLFQQLQELKILKLQIDV